MKSYQNLIATILLAAGGLALLAPSPSGAQATSPPADSPALTSIVEEIDAQQKTIADNQSKIDEKLAAIGEDIRQARIYTSRGR